MHWFRYMHRYRAIKMKFKMYRVSLFWRIFFQWRKNNITKISLCLCTDHFNLKTIDNWRGARNIVLLEKTEEIRNNEGYSIEVDPRSNKIILRARDEPGMFYAVQTLKALADRNGNAFILPEVTIFDEPRFPYRGMHLDVARNFHSKEEVSKR